MDISDKNPGRRTSHAGMQRSSRARRSAALLRFCNALHVRSAACAGAHTCAQQGLQEGGEASLPDNPFRPAKGGAGRAPRLVWTSARAVLSGIGTVTSRAGLG